MSTRIAAPVGVGIVVSAAFLMPTVAADPGAPACSPGYVWRAARPGDAVCVSPQDRDTTAKENAAAPQNVQPNDGNVCKPGFVWRNAFSGDAACVTPPQRDDAARQNSAAASHTVSQATGCQKWRSPGNQMGFVQDDGRSVTVEISGQTWGPRADYAGGGKPTFHGNVVPGGTINGGNLAMNINWDNGWKTRLSASIHPDGTATGGDESFPPPSQPDVPVARANVHSADKFVCA